MPTLSFDISDFFSLGAIALLSLPYSSETAANPNANRNAFLLMTVFPVLQLTFLRTIAGRLATRALLELA